MWRAWTEEFGRALALAVIHTYKCSRCSLEFADSARAQEMDTDSAQTFFPSAGNRLLLARARKAWARDSVCPWRPVYVGHRSAHRSPLRVPRRALPGAAPAPATRLISRALLNHSRACFKVLYNESATTSVTRENRALHPGSDRPTPGDKGTCAGRPIPQQLTLAEDRCRSRLVESGSATLMTRRQ